LIAQSLNQLEKAYGPHNAILDNCHIRLTYGANDDKTAKRISDLLGQATEKKIQKSYSGSGWFLSNRTESEQEYARPLLTPAEVNQLPRMMACSSSEGLRPTEDARSATSSTRALRIAETCRRRLRRRTGRGTSWFGSLPLG